MLLPLGSGISKHNNVVPSANLPSKHHVQDVKCPEMIVYPSKANANITSIYTVFSNGLKKVHRKIVHYVERNGLLRIDFMIAVVLI